MSENDLSNPAATFERNRYTVLPSLLRDPELAAMYRYARKIADLGATHPDDEQVPGTPSFYGDFMMEGLMTKLLPKVEEASSLMLFPTYAYFRVYKKGNILKRHIDRPSCEISVTLCLGYEGHHGWPIWIEGPHGATSIALDAGDALLYRGVECPHWREQFEGTRLGQVFLHYVDQNGPNAEWKFDKRTSLKSFSPSVIPRKP